MKQNAFFNYSWRFLRSDMYIRIIQIRKNNWDSEAYRKNLKNQSPATIKVFSFHCNPNAPLSWIYILLFFQRSMLQINTKHHNHICDGCTSKLTLATKVIAYKSCGELSLFYNAQNKHWRRHRFVISKKKLKVYETKLIIYASFSNPN